MANTAHYPVVFVGAGPGDPDLITVKGQKALEKADVILYAGSLVPTALLNWAKPNTERIDTAGLDLEAITDRMVAAQREGKRVVRLHTGDPALYGAIQEQMDILDREGVSYEIIPGITAAWAVAAAVKRELTLPEITQTVIFTRAAGRTPVPERESLEMLARHRATLAIYLSVHNIHDVVRALLTAYPPETPAVVAYRVSWPDETIIRGILATIADEVQAAGIRRQAVIMVGPTLGDREAVRKTKSRLYAADFSHGYRSASD